MAKEWGQIAYQFVYKSIPIYLVYYFAFSLHLPGKASTFLYVAIALAGAAYLSICINYLIGASALWTTESSWLYWGNHAMINLLTGFFIPIEWVAGLASDDGLVVAVSVSALCADPDLSGF